MLAIPDGTEGSATPDVNDKFDSDDDIALADLAGLRWSANLRPHHIEIFEGTSPGAATNFSKEVEEVDFLNLLFKDKY